jgi:hypothetical protein
MPYISQADRAALAERDPKTAGELNYLVTKLCLRYLAANGVSYAHFNDILGALEGVKFELYRRKIAQYEDLKRDLNGDVY